MLWSGFVDHWSKQIAPPYSPGSVDAVGTVAEDREMSKAASLCLISSAYLVAIGVACVWLAWGPATGMLWLDTLIADVLATLVVFVFSRCFGNSSFYDAYWSVIPPLLVAYWWFQSLPQVNTTRCVLIAVVVTLWAVRLTGNWVWGFPGLHHEDWRYPALRQRAGRWEFVADLFGIHLCPHCRCLPAWRRSTSP